jgi:uncharacterized protein
VLRVTADSNVYISALSFRGIPDQVLDLARTGEIQVSISDFIMGEVTRVLRDKFGWSQQALDFAATRIADFTEKVTPTQTIDVIKEDPSDNRILDCAIEGKSDYIVTGDKDLLRLKKLGNIQIVTPAAFLETQQGFGEGKKPVRRR